MNSRNHNEDFERLTAYLVAGTISRKDEQRLFTFIRDQWGIPDLSDDQIRFILVTGHDEYGAPGEDGEAREV